MVAVDPEKAKTVSIEHFYGISPRRYRDIFEKVNRQTDEGDVQKWYLGKVEPRLGDIPVGGTGREIKAVIDNLYSKNIDMT